MQKLKYFSSILKGIIFVTFILSSCSSNKEDIFDINIKRPRPVGVASNVRMVYTDSMKVLAILTTNKHIDYTNLTFKYSEFPDGVKVVFYDNQNRQSELTSDFAVIYEETKIIDLRGNVFLRSSNGAELFSQQLYWDATDDWIFTEFPFEFNDQDYQISATRLDANKEFTKFRTGNLTGKISIQESRDSVNYK